MNLIELVLVTLAILIAAYCAYLLGKARAYLTFKAKEKEIRADAAKRSRAVIGGQFSEQLAPYLPDFPYLPTEVKFLGKPTDFIVFEGLDKKNVERVVFVEVKSGKSSLTKTERSLKNAIENKSVSFKTYTIPTEITGESNGKA